MEKVDERVEKALKYAERGMSASQQDQLKAFREFKAALKKAGVYKEERYNLQPHYGYDSWR